MTSASMSHDLSLQSVGEDRREYAAGGSEHDRVEIQDLLVGEGGGVQGEHHQANYWVSGSDVIVT